MLMGHPQASCLRQVESYFKDMGMAGPVSGQTEAKGVPSQGGRGDAMFRRYPHA